MHVRAIEQLKLEVELRLAAKRKEFCLRYQPVVSLEDGRPVGVEAFARWQHPNRGLLAPVSFLSVAEESGLIVDIGWWIFREACTQMKAWQDRFQSARSLAIHVNLSGKELFQPELPERIEAVLAETGLKPEHLVLDIPENVIMHKAESSVTILVSSNPSRSGSTWTTSEPAIPRSATCTDPNRHAQDRPLLHPAPALQRRELENGASDREPRQEPGDGRHCRRRRKRRAVRTAPKTPLQERQGSFFEEPLTDDEMARFLSRPDASGKSPRQK